MLMSKTLDDYKTALKAKYEEVKNEDVSGLLSHPSPANLKTLCMIKAEEKTGIDDTIFFKRFFKVNDGENLLVKIESFDIDKFRPAGNFLKGKTGSTSRSTLEIIAIIVDFDLRPYGKFSKLSIKTDPKEAFNPEKPSYKNPDETPPAANMDETSKEEKKPEKPPVIILISDDGRAQGMSDAVTKNEESLPKPKQNKTYRSLPTIVTGIILFSILGYTVKQEFYPEKKCLEWKIDHYEHTVCKGSAVDSLYQPRPLQANNELLRFRKLNITAKTRFFINGQPAVWYSKDNNVVEFFNAPGVHPITGESLKPVTRHIVETYARVP